MSSKIQINLHYGQSKARIKLSLYDEHLLREVVEDRERWTRKTPSGFSSYEPLFESIERIDSHYCYITPGPYVGKVSLIDSEISFSAPKWLEGIDSSHLIYMMTKSTHDETKVAYLPEFITENPVSVSELSEPLYSLYVSELFKTLKKGKFKKYENQKVVSPNLKGKLDISKQITLNMRGQALFATNQNVYTEDHEINKLLYYANSIVIEKTLNDKTLESAIQTKRRLPYFPKNEIINLKKINLPRRANHYKLPVALAKLIILGKSISFQGSTANVFSLVINLFDLFEKYISSELFVRDIHYNSQITLPLNDTKSSFKSWDRRTIYPDIIYSSKSKNIVMDVKLKNISKYGPKIEDVYQISFYSHQLGLKSGVLIYPSNAEEAEVFNFPTSYKSVQNTEIIAYKLPIAKPPKEMDKEIDKLHDFLLKTP